MHTCEYSNFVSILISQFGKAIKRLFRTNFLFAEETGWMIPIYFFLICRKNLFNMSNKNEENKIIDGFGNKCIISIM